MVGDKIGGELIPRRNMSPVAQAVTDKGVIISGGLSGMALLIFIINTAIVIDVVCGAGILTAGAYSLTRFFQILLRATKAQGRQTGGGYYDESNIIDVTPEPVPDGSKRIEQLKKDIAACKGQMGEVCEKHINRSISQVTTASSKFNRFADILSRKVEKDSLLYTRVTEAAENIYGTIISSLEDVLMKMQAVNEINLQDNRKKMMDKDTDFSVTLIIGKRLELRQDYISKIQEVLDNNETFLTDLDNAISKMLLVKQSADDKVMRREFNQIIELLST